ncbi:MAG: hypothetical protein WBY47_11110 [Desulfobacterales bacterium]
MKQLFKDKKNTLTYIVLFIFTASFLIGCAGTGKMTAFQMDEMLARSGFQLRTADTPEKLDLLKSLPKNRFLHKKRNDKELYFYVNDASCRCMYIGNEKAYRRFKQSVKENQLDKRIDTTSSEVRRDMQSFPFDTNNPFNAGDHLP